MSVCPHMGDTDWAGVFGNVGALGLSAGPPGGYNANDEKFYYNTMGQMSLNLMVVNYGPTGSINGRPGAPKGNLTSITRPAEVILSVSESTWGWGMEIDLNLGNGLVWPSWPNSACAYYLEDGWTRYPHNGFSDGDEMEWYAHPQRHINNKNLQGFAVFSFSDGHAKSMKYHQAERCEPAPGGATWTPRLGQAPIATYYPHWIPEI
jgi:hypothetical protein